MSLPRIILLLLCCLSALARAGQPCNDLSDWQAGQLRELDGAWQLRWIEPQGEPRSVRLPFTWEQGQVQPWGEVGFGRIELTTCLRLPASETPLALYFDDFKSAARVWVDEQLVLQRGVPGGVEHEQARLQSGLAALPPGAREVRVRVELSNHFHHQGGIDSAVLLGERDALQLRAERHRALYLLILGAALIMALFMGLLDRRRSGVLGGGPFALMLVLAGMRAASTGELLDEFLHLPALWIYRLEYLSGHLFVPAYGYLLLRLFPAETRLGLVRLMLLVGVCGALLTLLLPAAFFTLLRDPLVLWLMLCQGYFFWVTWRALRLRRRGAPVILGGMLAIVVTVANDMLMHSFSVRTVNLIPLGVLVLLLSHGLVVGERVVGALLHSNRLRAELERLNSSLEQRVEERTRALAVARDQAQHEARQALERQLLLSHELRTPLVAIQGHLQLLDSADLPDAAAARLATVQTAARSLTELLDGFALLSRQEGVMLPPLEPFEPRALLEGCAAIFRPQAEAKGLSLLTRLDDSLPDAVAGRATTLRQLLFNLIGNSVKFTREGEICVHAWMGEQGLCVRVSDTGPGMPEQLQQEVFHAFVRGQGEPEPGLGLGLYVVARLVEMLGGQVALHSEPGQGTHVSVQLPWRALERAPQSSEAVGASRLPGLQVLLVEDVEASRLVTCELLERWGCLVQAVASGEEAVGACALARFDLVLMDLRLPGIDGLEASRQIRQGPGGEQLRILALTANAGDLAFDLVQQAGMDGLLGKPLQQAELLAALDLHGQRLAAATTSEAQRLQQLREWLGESHLQRLLPALLASLREVREGLLALDDDPAGLEHLCHRLRGSAISFGLLTLAEAAAAVRGPADVAALLCLLDQELAQLARDLPGETGERIAMPNPEPL